MPVHERNHSFPTATHSTKLLPARRTCLGRDAVTVIALDIPATSLHKKPLLEAARRGRDPDNMPPMCIERAIQGQGHILELALRCRLKVRLSILDRLDPSKAPHDRIREVRLATGLVSPSSK
jgi:hypothetical protein